MGNINSINSINTNNIKKINFQDMQTIIKSKIIIINTLSEKEQECLIQGTINILDEVKFLNECLNNSKHRTIVIYGKNCND